MVLLVFSDPFQFKIELLITCYIPISSYTSLKLRHIGRHLGFLTLRWFSWTHNWAQRPQIRQNWDVDRPSRSWQFWRVSPYFRLTDDLTGAEVASGSSNYNVTWFYYGETNIRCVFFGTSLRVGLDQHLKTAARCFHMNSWKTMYDEAFFMKCKEMLPNHRITLWNSSKAFFIC